MTWIIPKNLTETLVEESKKMIEKRTKKLFAMIDKHHEHGYITDSMLCKDTGIAPGMPKRYRDGTLDPSAERLKVMEDWLHDRIHLRGAVTLDRIRIDLPADKIREHNALFLPAMEYRAAMHLLAVNEVSQRCFLRDELTLTMPYHSMARLKKTLTAHGARWVITLAEIHKENVVCRVRISSPVVLPVRIGDLFGKITWGHKIK